MPTPPDSLNDIARAIQLALAPAFLLSGIVGLLNVMVGRLARIVDRGKGLTEGSVAVEFSERDSVHRELQSLPSFAEASEGILLRATHHAQSREAPQREAG